MKNFILLAMSTLGTIENNKFITPSGPDIENSQSQLEPIVRYILREHKEEESYVFSMATKDALKEIAITPPLGREGISKRSAIEIEEARKKKEDYTSISAQDFFEDRIRKSAEYKACKECTFGRVEIDLKKPEEAIKKAAEEIKRFQRDEGNDVRVWIDTHGGLRDVAFLINIVAFLMGEITDIKIAGIYGTEFTQDRTVQKIADQSNAFNSLSFVTGMSDFINFGNVRVLKEYYRKNNNYGEDRNIVRFLEAMAMVSDGTRFCDPSLYIQGLDELGKVIPDLESEHEKNGDTLLPIFYGTIKEDYGNLLDSNVRTHLDIIKHCIRKEQYQQALTFIEALMPEYFFRKRIMYYEGDDVEVAKTAAEGYYKSPINNAFDCFMDRMRDCFPNGKKMDVRNNLYVKVGIFAGKTKVSDFDTDFSGLLREDEKNDLRRRIKDDLPINEEVIIGKLKKDGGEEEERLKIKYLTDVSTDNRKRVAMIMRMHNILKNSRNKFNHAVSGDKGKTLKERRPELEDVVEVMNCYVKEISDLDEVMRES